MEIRNISKRYGDDVILENISLEISKGERVMIIGPSGRGKTTFLRIIMGLEKPDSGTITGNSEKISAVFQEDRLPLEFTAAKCVKMTSPRKVSKQDITAHLSELGLAEHINKPIRELSGGMKRRVAICRAVLSDAETICMDEPFTGLDIETKLRVIEYIKKHTKGKTILLVSHSEEDAELLNAKKIRI